jgi:hypothetical protein
MKGRLIVASIFLIIFPPIAWAMLWPVYKILSGSAMAKVSGAKDFTKNVVIGFLLGFVLMILGYLPAVIGGFVIMYKIVKH